MEGAEQLEEVASHLARRGVRLIRGGAFKPRTSPYSFQGLGRQALTLLSQVARRHGLAVVTEVLDPRDLEAVLECADVLQIGARNMYNYPLLQEVGRTAPHPAQRSFQATLEELLLSAEHVMSQGNDQVILCERGIRTFERWTRSTLDISAVPLLKQESHLPWWWTSPTRPVVGTSWPPGPSRPGRRSRRPDAGVYPTRRGPLGRRAAARPSGLRSPPGEPGITGPG